MHVADESIKAVLRDLMRSRLVFRTRDLQVVHQSWTSFAKETMSWSQGPVLVRQIILIGVRGILVNNESIVTVFQHEGDVRPLMPPDLS